MASVYIIEDKHKVMTNQSLVSILARNLTWLGVESPSSHVRISSINIDLHKAIFRTNKRYNDNEKMGNLKIQISRESDFWIQKELLSPVGLDGWNPSSKGNCLIAIRLTKFTFDESFSYSQKMGSITFPRYDIHTSSDQLGKFKSHDDLVLRLTLWCCCMSL